MSLLNDSAVSTLLFRIENLFDGQPLTQKYPQTSPCDFSSNHILPDVSLGNDLVDDLDQYLNNTDRFSDQSNTSSPAISPSSAALTQQIIPTSSSQFQFVLNALTASSARINEETTTYLNQGQPYEIKFSDNNYSPSGENHSLPIVYRSILRLCFWDKNLQAQERELVQKWLNEYQLSSLFDIDMNLTYGVLSVICSRQIPNAVEIVWDTSTTASLFVRFRCTSTDFAQKRHGGEKGIPLRIQIDTYHENDVADVKHLHSCCCKIQLFRLKGAQRKNKADKMRIDKLNQDQRRRYQITSEYTILQPCAVSSLYTLQLLSLSHPPDDLSDVYTQPSIATDNLIVTKQDNDNCGSKSNPNHSTHCESLSPTLPDVKCMFSKWSKDKTDIQTKITVRSSNDDVLKWLKASSFSSVLNRFEHYTGIDLLRLTSDEIRRICNDDESISIRLYNLLHETVVPPVRTFYIKTTHSDIYSAVYLHTLTRDDLQEKLCELTQQRQACNMTLEFNKIQIQIDSDNVVKYSMPDQGRYFLKIVSREFILSSINASE
ncbi:unnamed protein product [Adineta ricciae]|uniref:Grh/CP2 DB domain-containing protein n=1 Tax=Adineta ricciae TaxID=249248 RepID=A0A814GBG7_ADIRI|nr:unnamed protein product [Adineta ricciae]